MGELKTELQKRTYVLGEEISGTIHISLDKPASQRSAMLYLTGRERTEVRYTVTVGSGKHGVTETRTAVEENGFVREESPLTLPIDEEGRFKLGSYSIPFRFALPQGLPGTYKGANAEILYKVEGKTDVPMGFDIRDEVKFDVRSAPQASQARLVNPCSDSWANPGSAGVSFTLERCQYRRGEDLAGRCAYRNPESKNLRKIDISLKWIETARAEGHSDTHGVADCAVEVPIGGRLAKGESPFSIRIPEGAPQTYASLLSSVKCVLTSKLDIAWSGDVAAAWNIDILGTVGDEKLLIAPYAYGRADAEKAPSVKAYRSEYARTETVWCSYCGTAVKTPEAQYCPSCGSRLHTRGKEAIPPTKQAESEVKRRMSPPARGIDHCVTCGGEFGPEDNVVWCPHCGKLAHREHLLEWIRGKGCCPACGKSLSEEYYE